ncbi:MAG: DNA repair protein RadA, partial [Bacteroidales bacterium]|nr:DNA repair protein RadA [Bacteroidales bacterium]
LSSAFDPFISPQSGFAAEVGLGGEIRPVSQVERRIAEAEKLGFEEIYISSFNRDTAISGRSGGSIKIIPVSSVAQLCRHLFG